KADIYVTQSCDVVVEDAAGAAVQTIYCPLDTLAQLVAVANTGFTGTLANGAQGAGGKTNLDTILTSIYTSLGGPDGNYKESAGATNTAVSDFLGRLVVSVRDFGAVGDGATDDTSACQAAIARVIARGGGEVYFPKGNYAISAALAVAPVNTNLAVALVGAGKFGCTITSTSGTANAITATVCNGFAVRDLYVNGTSTGSAIVVAGCSEVSIERIVTAGYVYGLDIIESGSTVSSYVNCTSSQLGSIGTHSSGVRIGQGASHTGGKGFRFSMCSMFSVDSGVGIAIGGTVTDVVVDMCDSLGTALLIGDGTFVTACSGIGGRGVRVTGSAFLGATPFVIAATGAIQFYESGNYLAAAPAKSDATDNSYYGSAGWMTTPIGLGRTQTLTGTPGGSDVVLDIALGNIIVVQATGAGNVGLAAPTSGGVTIVAGTNLRVILQVGGVGITAWAWSAVFKDATYKTAYSGHGALALSSCAINAGKTAVLDFAYDGVGVWVFMGGSEG
ncbi:MAG: glycosyl hydrolase family 28-related protein, partial [bacterium]